MHAERYIYNFTTSKLFLVQKMLNISEKNKIALWQGDITTLKCDAIVNAANSQMLGCFLPSRET